MSLLHKALETIREALNSKNIRNLISAEKKSGYAFQSLGTIVLINHCTCLIVKIESSLLEIRVVLMGKVNRRE